MRNKSLLFSLFLAGVSIFSTHAQSTGLSSPEGLEWHIGAEISPAFIPGTNVFLEGSNPQGKRISYALSGAVRADFSFAPYSKKGLLYKGLYQGIGIGVFSFLPGKQLGTPVSAYVYQGSPIFSITNNLWLGYEWKFGAAFGWKHKKEASAESNEPVSTAITAHLGLALKMHYRVGKRCNLFFGVEGNHFSNGNTSWPNAGVNSIGVSAGLAYTINPVAETSNVSDESLIDTDKGRWFYDIVTYGAWRKRVVGIGQPPVPDLCPGKFGVIGLQFAAMRQLNRWIAVGPALDLQWDESAGLGPYWVEGTYEKKMKFRRPPFSKQISAGISAHGELTMPIFTVNAGLGYDFVNPVGNFRFFQSLTLKTFVSDNLFINVGYRLGSFKTPQNLMLGIGVRL